MTSEFLAVVIPTVKGREDVLGKAIASLRDAPQLATYIIHDCDTCGEAWNEGLSAALFSNRATHVLLFADDLYAADSEWFTAAVACLANGEIPCPMLLEEGTGNHWNVGDGTPGNQYAFSRVPMFTLEMARLFYPVPAIHYYSDCWIGSKASALGISCRVTAHYSFFHSWSPVGRIAGDNDTDRVIYETEINRL